MSRLAALLRRRRHRDAGVHPEAIEFLPPVEQILVRPPPPGARLTLHVLTLSLIAALGVSAVAEVDMVVIGTGKLNTTAVPVVIQPLDRAVVRRLLVRPGDVVRKGDLLATLDATTAQAEVEQLTEQHRTQRAQLARLEAELGDRPYAPDDPADGSAILQHSLFLQRAEFARARLEAFDQGILRIETALAAAQQEADNLKGQVATANEVRAMRQELLKTNAGSRLQFLEAQNLVLRFERDQQATAGRIRELHHAIAEKRSERQAFVEDWKRQGAEELVRLRQEAGKVAELLTKARYHHALVQVHAPEDGVVLEVAQRSAGSVLREAEALIVLVPLNSPLEAEVEVASADVGYVKPGDPVRLKVDAFPFQRHGLLQGTLDGVSQGSFAPGRDGTRGGGEAPAGPPARAVHRGTVTLTETTLRNPPPGSRLIPGMTVTAEIKVGSRTVLSYILWPIMRGLDEGLREP